MNDPRLYQDDDDGRELRSEYIIGIAVIAAAAGIVWFVVGVVVGWLVAG